MTSSMMNRSLSLSHEPDLGTILVQTGAGTLPKTVLIGAILETVSNYNRSTAEKVKEWSMVGESFLQGFNR
jgi:hypothetical protein